MVDRYLLPVPKAKNLKSYMRLKNKPIWSIPYVIGVFVFAFQLNRYSSLRTTASKPAGYYLDWGSKDAPAKVRYFSSEK